MHPSPPIPMAPYPIRLRLALSALLVAWVFAAIFLFLGWRANAQASLPEPVESSAPVSHADGAPTAMRSATVATP